MENLEQRLEILRSGVGNMQHGLPGDEDYYTAAEVIYAAIAELRRLREVIDAARAEVERHKMTTEERRGVEWAVKESKDWADESDSAFDQTHSDRAWVLLSYLERTNKAEGGGA
jgi:hypothetical protein